MSKRFESRICWLSKEQGGRQGIPFGDKYAPIIKITKPLVQSNDFWSVFVTNIKLLCENETLSNIRYLSEFAPDDLSAGVEFMLYEGNKNVATGVIVREI